MSDLPPLVSAAWLAAALQAPDLRVPDLRVPDLRVPDLRVLDASFYLPTEPHNARALFTEAHIPGARFFDLDDIADHETDLPHMVPTQGKFARAVAALGISNSDRVVIYDQKGIFSAPRAWWTFRVFGHDRVAVLDGGLPAWRAFGGPLESGAPTPPIPGVFQPNFRATRVRGLGDMLANLETGAEIVVDARPAGRFNGTAPEPRPGMPSGHIPGAVNLPASDLAPGGKMLPPDLLRARFTAAGVDGTRRVVTSCGTGVTAAVLTFGMHLAGLPEGSLYDGSWTEWGARADTPKE